MTPPSADHGQPRNGAHALLSTLRANGVTTCFMNPGTSEMHFVAALDEVTDFRGVLCLFEGVATGAADGFARVTGRPAATLLHLGPGLANGWANLHNARRAHSPIVNVIGDHATYHRALDAPLQSDIGALAGALEGWVGRCDDADDVAALAAEAVSRAYGPPGRVATLILAADASWSAVTTTPTSWPTSPPAPLVSPDQASLDRAITALRSTRCAVLVGSSATDAHQLALAQRVCDATSSKFIMETFPAIFDHGAGVSSAERLIYLSEFATAQLADVETLVLVGSIEPVSFFAYPTLASRLVAPGCDVIDVAPPGVDTRTALEFLVDALHAPESVVAPGERPGRPSGDLTNRSFAAAIGATLPEDVIIADESNTSGVHLLDATRFAPAHRWMTLTGGSIGMGLPVATGAALASGQRVVALESDGSLMYTPQALWTMAREGLDVTVVALSNRSYAILNFERQRVGVVGAGAPSQRMLDLDGPALDLCSIARAQGVGAVRVTTADELVEALERSYATPGPSFIEAMLPAGLS